MQKEALIKDVTTEEVDRSFIRNSATLETWEISKRLKTGIPVVITRDMAFKGGITRQYSIESEGQEFLRLPEFELFRALHLYFDHRPIGKMMHRINFYELPLVLRQKV